MKKLAVIVSSMVASGLLAVSAGASPDTVDITVVLAIGTHPEDTRTFHAADVVVGDGVELDVDDETVPNETGFVGAIAVDVDPLAETITLLPREEGGLYDRIHVTIAGEGFDDIVMVSDDLLEPNAPYALTMDAGPDGLRVAYDAPPGDLFELKAQDAPAPNIAVFGYEYSPVETSTTSGADTTSTTLHGDVVVTPAPVATPTRSSPTFTG